MLPKFKVIPIDRGGSYAIYMNDVQLHGVSAVHIDMAVNEIPKVQLEFIPDSIVAKIMEAEVSETTECREDNHDQD